MEIHIIPNGGAAIFLNEDEAGELWSDPEMAKTFALRLLGGKITDADRVEVDYYDRGGHIMLLVRSCNEEDIAGGRIFDNLETLLEGVSALSYDEPTELYDCDGHYWLFCRRDAALRRLEEFGSQADINRFPYVREHGKLLIGSFAAARLKHYFVDNSKPEISTTYQNRSVFPHERT